MLLCKGGIGLALLLVVAQPLVVYHLTPVLNYRLCFDSKAKPNFTLAIRGIKVPT
jgi:hypothetical protein